MNFPHSWKSLAFPSISKFWNEFQCNPKDKMRIYDWNFTKKKKGIITVNPPGVRPVYTIPTRGSKLITLPTWGAFR